MSTTHWETAISTRENTRSRHRINHSTRIDPTRAEAFNDLAAALFVPGRLEEGGLVNG